MLYMKIEHWEDFKRASGRSHKFSNEGFQALFQHFYEMADWNVEEIEIHYDLFRDLEECDNAIQAIPYKIYDEIKLDRWKFKLEMAGIEYDEESDEIYDFEPDDDEIEPYAMDWLKDNYDTVLELPCCGGVIIDWGSKKD